MHADYGVGLALNSWRGCSIPSLLRCCCSGCHRQGRRAAAVLLPRKRRRSVCAGGRRAGDPRTTGSGPTRSPSQGPRPAGASAARSATCPRRQFSVHPSRGRQPELRGAAELGNTQTRVRASAFGRHRIIAEARSSARGIRWGLSEATAKRTNPNTPASSAALTAFQQAAVATGANHGRLSTSYPSLRGRSRRTDRRRKHTHTGNETSQTQFRRR